MLEQEEGQNIIMDLHSRTRSLEGKYNLLRDRVLVINQNMIDEYKKILSELRAMNSEIKELRDDIFKIKDTIKNLVKEMEFVATKSEVKILEKYINVWNPMNFVTEKEVQEIVDEKIKEKESKKKEVKNARKKQGK